MKTILFCGLVMFAGAVAFAQDAAKKGAAPAAAPAAPQAMFLSAAELKWGDAPPDFPKGGQITVLFGNPGEAGPFAIRFKMPDGYKIKPHYHSQDEQLTVLSGTLILHMGDTMKTPPHAMEAGGFHFLPAKMHHSAETKGETVLEMHGTGPFDIKYLNPADNPAAAKPAAPAKK